MFRVAIVEDDYMVAMVNRSFVEKDGRFQVVKEFSAGKQALSWLLSNPVDLVIMDVYMPLMNGVELLESLRSLGFKGEAIVVSAAHEVDTLQKLLKLGITDYLIKPFSPQRFQQALDGFCENLLALEGKEEVCQADVDKLLHVSSQKECVPKGFQTKTLEKIREELFKLGEDTCENVAVKANVSVVTARRYLNYMLERGDVNSRINYDTGGRPCVVYFAGESLDSEK